MVSRLTSRTGPKGTVCIFKRYHCRSSGFSSTLAGAFRTSTPNRQHTLRSPNSSIMSAEAPAAAERPGPAAGYERGDTRPLVGADAWESKEYTDLYLQVCYASSYCLAALMRMLSLACRTNQSCRILSRRTWKPCAHVRLLILMVPLKADLYFPIKWNGRFRL